MKRIFLAIVASALALAAESSRAASESPPPKQFIGVLRLVPRLHADAAWTKADEEAVGKHFQRLQVAAKEKKVIFAGRTTESNEKTFGLVVFDAATAQEAESFMASDPVVIAGVMTFELHPYYLAVTR